ncbi:hypothetical protein HF1_05770 [Mycoplasma haemofelis str. Langford 1]|uniref:Uncharacterized protein n=1 Tax=Mycoplasma haemofelis (strain Langford 1) TaxID=941640 RepID=E8ZHG4_MYCHL|nr:hypothetical protein HF1_05770 [Mycoplasma haemofelis str. Langford 1]
MKPEIARDSQIILTKAKETPALPEVTESNEVVVSEPVEEIKIKCDIYSVQSSDATKGKAKLEGESFLEQEITDSTLKQQIKEVCSSSHKVYVAKVGGKWVYRSEDQSKQWTDASIQEEEKCLLYAVQSSANRTVKLVDYDFVTKEVRDVVEKQEIDNGCRKTKKVYIANLGSRQGWGYRSADQSGNWNVVF